MTKLTSPIAVATAFSEYVLDTVLGEGGAGRVYGGVDGEGQPVAVKLLTQSTADKRRRFKNEISFLAKTRHPNLVPVTDYGLSDAGKVKGPFYVMPRYEGGLRTLMKPGVAPDRLMALFGQVLDGVEAAHLLGVAHRDLKPENILVAKSGGSVAVADFGIASFTAEQLATVVETGPGQRLANFMYAAPEQRTVGSKITASADIYALGLLLNEMFTGSVPHGTSYKQIGDVDPASGYLDQLVSHMIAQAPAARPRSIEDVKIQILKYRSEAVTLQRLSQIEQIIIPAGQVDEPLAHEPPKLVGADWNNGMLTLTLDRPVNRQWVDVLQQRLGNFSYPMNAHPSRWQFSGTNVTVGMDEGSAQSAIDNFKAWLPQATRVYRQELEQQLQRREQEQRRALAQQRAVEEQRLRVNRNLKF